MSPTTYRWLFIALIALVTWRLLPLSTEQELAAANRAWRTGHFDEATRIWTPLAEQGQTLGLGLGKLRFGLGHVCAGDDTPLVLTLGEAQGPRIGGDGGIKKGNAHIQGA